MVSHKKSLIIACFVALMMVYGVSAMTCQYDPRPYISVSGKTIDWLCQVNHQSECYGLIMYDTGTESGDMKDLISVSPEPRVIDEYGKIDSFSSENLFVNIRFRTTDLVQGVNYTFKAVCVSSSGTEEYSDSISPSYSELRSTPYIYTYIIRNSAEIVIIFLFVVFIGLIYFMRRR